MPDVQWGLVDLLGCVMREKLLVWEMQKAIQKLCISFCGGDPALLQLTGQSLSSLGVTPFPISVPTVQWAGTPVPASGVNRTQIQPLSFSHVFCWDTRERDLSLSARGADVAAQKSTWRAMSIPRSHGSQWAWEISWHERRRPRKQRQGPDPNIWGPVLYLKLAFMTLLILRSSLGWISVFYNPGWFRQILCINLCFDNPIQLDYCDFNTFKAISMPSNHVYAFSHLTHQWGTAPIMATLTSETRTSELVNFCHHCHNHHHFTQSPTDTR